MPTVNKDMVIVSKYSDLPGSENLEIGQNVMLMNEMGMRFPVTVTAKDDDSITLDGNHRLAGKALNFDIVLVDVAE